MTSIKRHGRLCASALVLAVGFASCKTKAKTEPSPAKSETQAIEGSQRAPVPEEPRSAKDTTSFFESDFTTLELELSDASLARLQFQPREYARALLRHGGIEVATEAKIKGHRSFRSFDKKPAFKLRFDRKDEDGRFRGMRSLVLNNMVDDPTRLRETLGYALYRAARVPAPRTSFVKLSANGESFGLYLAVESIDENFLASHFADSDAGLYSADYGCDVYAADVAKMELKRGPESSRTQLAELAAQSEEGSIFGSGSLVNWHSVVSFLAVSTFLGDFDGYWHSHNYYLHNGAAGGTWSLVPWGIDRVFKKHLELFGSRGRLAELCFANVACRLRYTERLLQVADLAEELDLASEAARLLALVQAQPGAEARERTSEVRIEEELAELREFLRTRPAEIRETLSCLAAGQECNLASKDKEVCAWQIVHVGRAEFHLCKRLLSWHEAKEACSDRKMVLAEVATPEQSGAIGKAASAIDTQGWWIGASDLSSESKFEWADGRPLTWSNWADGQPNNSQCGQDCTVLEDDGRWADKHCEQHLPFVCSQGP